MHSLRDFSLTNEWSIGEEAFATLEQDMSQLEPRTIVEFGSGTSSIRLALAFPAARLLCLESNEKYFHQLQETLRAEGLASDRLRVELRPLKVQKLGWGLYQTYAPGPFPDEVDAVLIDGPPHSTKRGRQACLYQVANRLRVGGRVYLDDYDRPIERRVVQNWLRSYPGAFRVRREAAVGHGLCVVEKVREVPMEPAFSPFVTVDALAWLGYRLAEMGLERVLPPAR